MPALSTRPFERSTGQHAKQRFVVVVDTPDLAVVTVASRPSMSVIAAIPSSTDG